MSASDPVMNVADGAPVGFFVVVGGSVGARRAGSPIPPMPVFPHRHIKVLPSADPSAVFTHAVRDAWIEHSEFVGNRLGGTVSGEHLHGL